MQRETKKAFLSGRSVRRYLGMPSEREALKRVRRMVTSGYWWTTSAKNTADRQRNTQLFKAFPSECSLLGFTFFRLSACKFPQKTFRLLCWALADHETVLLHMGSNDFGYRFPSIFTDSPLRQPKGQRKRRKASGSRSGEKASASPPSARPAGRSA